MKLNEVINKIANLPNEDKVNIRGKYYTTVDTRLQAFRSTFETNANITTEIIVNDLERVVVKATVSIYKDGVWRDIGNDFAEEFRNQGPVNKTSALENCTTSAIGRALANWKYQGAKSPRPSKQEMSKVGNKPADVKVEKPKMTTDKEDIQVLEKAKQELVGLVAHSL